MSDDETILRGSGNVFADLGLPNPDEEMAKAKLALAVLQQIAARRLTQAQAANLAQTTPMHIRQLRRGKLSAFTHTELTRLLRGVSILCFILLLSTQAGAGIRKTATGHAKPKHTGKRRPIHYAAVSPDGRMGASFYSKSDIRIWDRRTDKLLYTVKHTPVNNDYQRYIVVDKIMFSHTSKWLLVEDNYQVGEGSVEPWHDEDFLTAWNTSSGRRIETPSGGGSIHCLAFTPDDSTLVYDCIGKWGTSCTLCKVDLIRGSYKQSPAYPSDDGINNSYETTLTPDGKTYKAVGFGPDHIIDIATFKPVAPSP